MNILMPLPHQDFDPTEVGTTWRILSEAGHHVHFATPDGLVAIADPLMISGEGLDAWGFVPGLKKSSCWACCCEPKGQLAKPMHRCKLTHTSSSP